jgi:hypothetical protein
MNNKSVRKFCDTYEAGVSPGVPRRKVVNDPELLTNFVGSNDDISKYAMPNFRTEEVETVQITMPRESFNALVGRQDYIEEILASGSAASMHPADRVWDHYQEEVRARNSCPGIQKAYEKYLMFLEIAGVRRLG